VTDRRDPEHDANKVSSGSCWRARGRGGSPPAAALRLFSLLPIGMHDALWRKAWPLACPASSTLRSFAATLDRATPSLTPEPNKLRPLCLCIDRRGGAGRRFVSFDELELLLGGRMLLLLEDFEHRAPASVLCCAVPCLYELQSVSVHARGKCTSKWAPAVGGIDIR
jgi:hypothetical protein